MVVYENVLCPVCGCLCDDIEVTVEENKIVKVKNACAVGASKFLNYYKERNTTPLIRKDGMLKPVELDEAINKVAEILVNADYPLIYGWSLCSSEAIKVGIELAEEVGGVIDNQSSVCHAPGIQALHDIGVLSCTLGEVKHRADLIIYWGCNPEDAHPRHLTRYSFSSKGRFAKDPSERKMIVVDVRNTSTAKKANTFILIEQGADFEFISALRAALKFEEIEEERVAGVPVEQIEEFAEVLRSCKFGVIFFGQGLTQSPGKSRNIEAAIALVRDLNDYTKFALIPIRGHYNVAGANEVTAWQTGFPYGVDFSKGYPWYNPGETTAVDILRRGESDAALVVGSDPLAHFPREAAEHLAANPLAVIDPDISMTAMAADVVIPSAFTGIEVAGTAYRMDRVALLVKKVVEPPKGVLSDEEILRMILKKVRSLKGVS
ncbi:MAG: formylmethanofuran dehydrogenase subunit B [Nitrososphaerales archaeon]|nr:formylmethanofuran dehydrogenase subunit B [Nitrososphaerales archaeon]